MNSRSAGNFGVQEPRVSLHPKAVDFADAEEAVELAAGYGLIPDPWQEHVIRGWMGRRRDGRLAAGRCGVAVPRQNGKNGSVEIVQLHKIVIQGRKILHTAHEVKTARKAFERLASFFENERKYPELAELVKAIRKTNGQEAIVLRNGGSCEFVARSRGSGRGYTVDDLFCDEAQELTDEQLEALLPTIAAAPSGDPQQFYLGTPPGPNSNGEVFSRVRKEGVLGKDKRLSWDEWSIPDETHEQEALKNWREYAAATNPALGFRLNITTVEDEKNAMSPEGFCRERLGRWDQAGRGNAAFDVSQWERLVDSDPSGDGKRVFVARFAVDGSGVALAAAVKPSTGVPHVEAIRWAPSSEGTGWLVDWLVERWRTASQIVVEGKSGVGFLLSALRDAGVPARVVWTPNVGQVTAAHSAFYEAVLNGNISHSAQPELDVQVADATKRKIGQDGGFGWAPMSEGGSVALLDAATLAFWGVHETKRKPSGGGKGVTLL